MSNSDKPFEFSQDGPKTVSSPRTTDVAKSIRPLYPKELDALKEYATEVIVETRNESATKIQAVVRQRQVKKHTSRRLNGLLKKDGFNGGVAALIDARPENMNVLELSKMMTVAEAAAREAGRHMKRNCGANVIKTKSSHADLLTEIDGECQKIVQGYIYRFFPTHDFLGEEDVEPGSVASAKAIDTMKTAANLWICDPIDGTTNFTHSVPCSVVSIGVAKQGMLVVGVIYDPYRDEMFSTYCGLGHILVNGKPAEACRRIPLENSLLAYGIKQNDECRIPTLRAVNEILTKAHGLRNLGAAALHLAWTAAGRLNGFWQLDLCPWDLSAGVLLIHEAGGVISDTRGVAYMLGTKDICVACSLELHKAVLKILKSCKADRRIQD
eukprot:g2880.t1